jgi:hypothetical protein
MNLCGLFFEAAKESATELKTKPPACWRANCLKIEVEIDGCARRDL